jgi:hypothetical protein
VEIDKGLPEHVGGLVVGVEAEPKHAHLGGGGDVLRLVVDEQYLKAAIS